MRTEDSLVDGVSPGTDIPIGPKSSECHKRM